MNSSQFSTLIHGVIVGTDVVKTGPKSKPDENEVLLGKLSLPLCKIWVASQPFLEKLEMAVAAVTDLIVCHNVDHKTHGANIPNSIFKPWTEKFNAAMKAVRATNAEHNVFHTLLKGLLQTDYGHMLPDGMDVIVIREGYMAYARANDVRDDWKTPTDELKVELLKSVNKTNLVKIHIIMGAEPDTADDTSDKEGNSSHPEQTAEKRKPA